jgi:hypothetical protein
VALPAAATVDPHVTTRTPIVAVALIALCICIPRILDLWVSDAHILCHERAFTVVL